ncbi:MAG: hypothetical protein WAO08_02075 [Hyphomicrobiaceae bacterium]
MAWQRFSRQMISQAEPCRDGERPGSPMREVSQHAQVQVRYFAMSSGTFKDCAPNRAEAIAIAQN